MTVLLLGVGADGDNTRPVPSIDSEGRYEYIPIPETVVDTDERRTYGTLPLRHRNGVASDIVNAIRPGGSGDWKTDPEEIREHPLHYDPDFTALTYGDRKGPGGKGTTLVRTLSPGDVIGFYTGLEGPDGNRHRYIYGYFSVASVEDLANIEGEVYHGRLRQFAENAHAKRLIGSGSPKHDSVVIVDGREPGGLLDHPYRISERLDSSPWYQLEEEFVEKFNVTNGQVAITRKIALTLEIDSRMFIDIVTRS